MNTQIQINTAEPIPMGSGEAKPYPQSFIDRLMNAVKRLPIPYWITYLILFILLSVVNHVVNWMDGWLPALAFSPYALSFPLWICFPLGVMTYLNGVAREALSNFGPLLDVPHETTRRLEYEFTTMPQRTALGITVVWIILYAGIMVSSVEAYRRLFGLGTVAIAFETVVGFFAFALGGFIYYHTIRQLRLVTKTTKLVKHFNLFHRDPAYAFSALTARTGIAWVFLLSLNALVTPIGATLQAGILEVVMVILAVAAFVLPLRVINQGLVAEKRKLLADHDERVETTLSQLHRSIENQALDEVPQINGVLTGLNAEGSILEKIPTWPWRAGLFAGFLSIVVLPIILFLIQLVLGRLLGP
jgi:hypothetical protein